MRVTQSLTAAAESSRRTCHHCPGSSEALHPNQTSSWRSLKGQAPRISRGMSCTGSAQAHGTFQDASAFFSEDEWKLLQGWQKELYRNVMKEIHQALISLGPLIAATVSSLRGKDQQELFPLEHRSADTRTCIDPSSGNKLAEGDVLLRVTHKEPKCHPHPEDSEWRQRHLNHRAEDPYLKSDLQSRKENVISLLIDHFGAEIGESTTDPNSEAEVVSFRIKDEDETYGKEHPGSPGTQAIGSPRDEPEMNKKRKSTTFKSILGTASAEMPFGNNKVKMFHAPESEEDYRRQLWPDVTQELETEGTSHCNSGFSKAAHFHLLQEIPQIQRSEYDDSGTHTNHTTYACQSSTQGESQYSCLMCDKSFSKKDTLFKHKRIHLGVRPYQCHECEKSFIRNDNLIVHMRTHTGERPYQCNMCEKSFSQKGILSRHQATHIGERPYQCAECEKSFNRKGNLSAHQKIHIQHRLSS